MSDFFENFENWANSNKGKPFNNENPISEDYSEEKDDNELINDSISEDIQDNFNIENDDQLPDIFDDTNDENIDSDDDDNNENQDVIENLNDERIDGDSDNDVEQLNNKIIEDSIESEEKFENSVKNEFYDDIVSEEQWKNQENVVNEIAQVERDIDNVDMEGHELGDYNNDYDDYNDDDYIDPEDEAIAYSSDTNNSISFNDLNDSNEDEEKEDSSYLVEEKRSFDSISPLSNAKSPFKPGKLNKTFMLSAIGVVLLFVLGLFYLQGVNLEKKSNMQNPVQNTVSLAGYEPDFGNYQERAYKPTKDDENKEDSKYIEDVFSSGNKRNYVPDTNSKTNSNNNTKDTQNNNTTYNTYNTYNNSNNTTTSTSTVVTDTSKIDSPIRLSSNGYLAGSNGYGYGYGYGYENPENYGYSNGPGGFVNANYNPYQSGSYEENFMNRLEKLTGATNSNSIQVQSDTSNKTKKMGEYNPDSFSGNYNDIEDNSLFPGTIIHAALISGIDTRYPGPIIARVINPVYDSKTGKSLLIPQGSILRGSYSSASFGVSKVQIAWNELIINRDGRSYTVNLGSMAGVDRQGRSGLAGTLHENTFQYFKAMGISCLFTFINSNIFAYTDAKKDALQRKLISDSQEIGNMLADKILDRALNIEPYIKVKQGMNISVSVDNVLTLPSLQVDKAKEKYLRK